MLALPGGGGGGREGQGRLTSEGVWNEGQQEKEKVLQLETQRSLTQSGKDLICTGWRKPVKR